jgi:hypothetical protein
MRLPLISLIALSLVLAGCGQVFVGFVSNPGGAMRVSGTISNVQMGFLNDGHGTLVTFTAVTFVNGGAATTINFCGDLQDGFPINRSAQANFTTGIYCATLVAVVIS